MVDAYLALHELEGEEAAAVSELLHTLARAVQDHDLDRLKTEAQIANKPRSRLQELALSDGGTAYVDPDSVAAVFAWHGDPETAGIVFHGGAELPLAVSVEAVLKLVRAEARSL